MAAGHRRQARFLKPLVFRCLLAFATIALSGCQTVQFYSQAVVGQVSILAKRQPVERVLANPETPEALRQKLQLTQDVRAFAERELGLPVDGAYAGWADLGRDYVVWNVFAAPEFSLELQTRCFPIAGCVSYQGYFSEEAARQAAERLADDGLDVYVGGVAAYSTLGWFDDPILNTFIHRSDDGLAALLFHEIAHRAVYVRDDTTFNESFASAVEQAAMQRWLADRGGDERFAAWLEGQRREQAVIRLILDTRQSLDALYRTRIAASAMRRRKAETIESMRQEYARLGEGHPFAGWMSAPINNAKLGTVAEYNRWVDAFMVLMTRSADFAAFLVEVETLARLEPRERNARLAELEASAQHDHADRRDDHGAEQVQHEPFPGHRPDRESTGAEHDGIGGRRDR